MHATHRAKAVLRRALAAVLALLMAVIGLTAASLPAAAADADDFDPGHIIADSLFWDGDAMTEAQVATFIDNKISKCLVGRVCLENYKETTRTIKADPMCKQYTGGTNESAARIITKVARACGVSPKAILVILQKEQSLVTDPSPGSRAFQAAMGAGCPDTAPCDGNYAGFFDQVHYGAYLLKRYTQPKGTGPGTAWFIEYNKRYPVGKTTNVLYHPDSSRNCGTKPVYIRNQATHALYIYTPYTPNQAALDNLYGTGDRCSAYGNRNFFRLYTDWFGDPQGGEDYANADLLEASSSGDEFLRSANTAYSFNGKASPSDFAGLGPMETVPDGYLSMFTAAGTVSYLVRDADSPTYYFVDRGIKHKLNQCSGGHGHAFKYSCGQATVLSPDQLAKIPTKNPVSSLVKEFDTGDRYFIAGGVRRAYTSNSALDKAGYTVPSTVVQLSPKVINHLPFGEPAVGAAQVLRGDDALALGIGGEPLRIPARLWEQAAMSSWFPVTDTPDEKGMPTAWAGTLKGLVSVEGSDDVYLLRSGGRLKLSADLAPDTGVMDLPSNVMSKIPLLTGELSGPTFLRAPEGDLYLVDNGMRRKIRDNADRAVIARSLGISEYTRTLPADSLAAFPGGGRVLAPGTVVQNQSNLSLWYIDGDYTRRSVTAAMAADLSVAPVRTVPSSWAASYTINPTPAGLGVMCGSQRFVVVGGQKHPVTAGVASHYPASFGFAAGDPLSCAATPTAAAMGQLVMSGTDYYVIQTGTARKVATGVTPSSLTATFGTATTVTPTFLQTVPAGTAYSGS